MDSNKDPGKPKESKTNVLESIEEKFLTCYICSDILNNPKILQCLHTYCKTCLIKHIESNSRDGEVNCPLCRKVIKLPSNDVEGLPDNFWASNLIEEVKGKSTINCIDYDRKLEKLSQDVTEQIKQIGQLYHNIETHHQYLVDATKNRALYLANAVQEATCCFDKFSQELTVRAEKCKEQLYVQQEQIKNINQSSDQLKKELHKLQERQENATLEEAKDIKTKYENLLKLNSISGSRYGQCEMYANSILGTKFCPGDEFILKNFGALYNNTIKSDVHIKDSSMTNEMQQFVIASVEKIYKDTEVRTPTVFAEKICEAMEGTYGLNWQCIVGITDKFGVKVKSKSQSMVTFNIEDLQVVLFKSHGGWFE